MIFTKAVAALPVLMSLRIEKVCSTCPLDVGMQKRSWAK